MKRTLLAASALVLSAVSTTAFASSHREAPMIAGMPRLDGTDFYMFNSYEPGRQGYVTFIANYIPLEDPFGGPNFFAMENNGYYDINIDNTGSGKPTYTLRFRFTDFDKGLALTVGGVKVAIPLINDGQITPASKSAQNVLESYTISLVTYDKDGKPHEKQLSSAGGDNVFHKPVDNIGDKSIPNYAEYANNFVYQIQIPGCSSLARVFVGQRKDPFVVNLGETFDLVNYAHPVGEQYNNSAMDDLAAKNVTSIVAEVAAGCLTRGTEPVIGGWTTSSLGTTDQEGQDDLCRGVAPGQSAGQ